MRQVILVSVIGLVIGVLIAFLIGYEIAPVQYTDGPISSFSQTYQDEYTLMVAAAYGVDCDINEAFNRLKPLGVSNIPVYIRDVTERYMSDSGTGKESDVRNLIALSRDMGYYTAPMQILVPQKTTCIPQQPGS